jgi:hypothetical protein
MLASHVVTQVCVCRGGTLWRWTCAFDAHASARPRPGAPCAACAPDNDVRAGACAIAYLCRAHQLSFPNDAGEVLEGELVTATGCAAPTALTIVCHGLDCTKDSAFLPLLSATLPSSSFRFSFRGCGGSEGVWVGGV